MNWLGKISLILSILCFLVTLGLRAVLGDWILFIDVGFGFGLFFLLFSIIINRRYFVMLIQSKRFLFNIKNMVLVTVFSIFLIALNYIVVQQRWSFDLTENKIHSLSPFTQNLVESLDEDVRFYYLYIDSKKTRGFENIVRREMEKYMILNPRIHFESHTIYKRPDLVKKFKVGDEESSLYMESKNRIHRIQDLQEREFVNAFFKLTREPKKLYFLELKNERSIENRSTFGLLELKQQLMRLHYEVDRISSLENLPEDIAVLILAGSREPFSSEEQGQLDQYLQKGGSLLVALDPGENHNLNPFFEKYGLQVENNFIFSEQTQADQSQLQVLTHIGQSQHEVSLKLGEGKNPVFFVSSSISILDSVNKKIQVTSLLEYLPNSVVHKDIDPSSPKIKQDHRLAAVISEQNSGSSFRLAVAGDSDFLTNGFYAQKANFEFILNLFSYLSQDEHLLKLDFTKSILPKTTYTKITNTQMRYYAVFFILPFCFIFFILGIFFKIRRRF